MALGRDAASRPTGRLGVRPPDPADSSIRPGVAVPVAVPLRISVFGCFSGDEGCDVWLVIVGLKRTVLVDQFRPCEGLDAEDRLLGDVSCLPWELDSEEKVLFTGARAAVFMGAIFGAWKYCPSEDAWLGCRPLVPLSEPGVIRGVIWSSELAWSSSSSPSASVCCGASSTVISGSSSSAIVRANEGMSSGSETIFLNVASGCVLLGCPAVLERRKYGLLRLSSRSKTDRVSSCGGVFSSSSPILLIQSLTTPLEPLLIVGYGEGVCLLGSRYGRRNTSSSARSL